MRLVLFRFVLLLAAAPLLFASSASAQITVNHGFKVGVNVTTIRVDEEAQSSIAPYYTTGFVAGAFATFDLLGPVKLRPEALVSRKGLLIGQEGRNGPAILSATYFEVPVLAKLALPTAVSPYLSAGPAFALRITESAQPNEGFRSGNLFRFSDLGLVLATGLDVRTGGRSLSLDVRLTNGVNNVLEGSRLGVDDYSKNRAITITASFGM